MHFKEVWLNSWKNVIYIEALNVNANVNVKSIFMFYCCNVKGSSCM